MSTPRHDRRSETNRGSDDKTVAAYYLPAMLATTLPDRAIIRLAGADNVAFLQGLVTNDVGAALPVWTGLLTPQGKVLFDFLVWRQGDDLLLDCEAVRSDALIARLTAYRLRRAVTITRMSELAVHWSMLSPDEPASLVCGPATDPRLVDLGWRWIGTPGIATDKWPEHRLGLGVTEGRSELGDGTTLWLECNAKELNGVSFTKGCYIGQENTARMHHRSTVTKRLVVAPVGDDVQEARIVYSDLGLLVERRRVGMLGDAIVPAWLNRAL